MTQEQPPAPVQAPGFPGAHLPPEPLPATRARNQIDTLPPLDVVPDDQLPLSPKTGEPKFVTVHAKIARGAYAGWLIRERIASTDQLPHFAELGYAYSEQLSTPSQPVFVCQEFGGIGMSVRLS